MGPLLDFVPLIVFFAGFVLYDIYVATIALMVAMAVQIAVQWVWKRHVSKMLLVSGALVLVFGAATLVLRDPLFVQWKTTVVNWLFAIAFLGSAYIGNKTFTERLLGQSVELPASMWRQLNMMWVINFAVLGAVNLFVVYHFDLSGWVNFKVWGMIGLSLLTAVAQAVWINAYLQRQSGEDR